MCCGFEFLKSVIWYMTHNLSSNLSLKYSCAMKVKSFYHCMLCANKLEIQKTY